MLNNWINQYIDSIIRCFINWHLNSRRQSLNYLQINVEVLGQIRKLNIKMENQAKIKTCIVNYNFFIISFFI